MTQIYGKPSLFITMTCNPKWKEITEALEPGQTWEDRADVVNRVFHLKLAQMLVDLRAGTFFRDKNGAPWKAKYISHVVEFQKRGKPHAHITMRFVGSEEDMPKTPAAVDALISAKLPVVDPGCACTACSAGARAQCLQQRKLDAVKKHMMHKCAVEVCLPREEPKLCRRGYPKEFCSVTTEDDGGYPIYARGPADSNVVPHNTGMLLKYDCHINVELCTTVWVHKYMVSASVARGALTCCVSHTYALAPHTHSHSLGCPVAPPFSFPLCSTSTCTRALTPFASSPRTSTLTSWQRAWT